MTHTPDYLRNDLDPEFPERIIDWTRAETDACEAGTPGCAVHHYAEQLARLPERGCETW